MLSNALKIYKKETNGHPYDMTPEEYDKILERMIFLCSVQFVDSLCYFLSFRSGSEAMEYCEKLQEWIDECKKELFILLNKHIGGIWW